MKGDEHETGALTLTRKLPRGLRELLRDFELIGNRAFSLGVILSFSLILLRSMTRNDLC